MHSREGVSGWRYNVFRAGEGIAFESCSYSKMLPTPEQAIAEAFGKIAIDKDRWIYNHYANVKDKPDVACV